ncbi:hypothetical protein Bxe_A0911 [Paraburkholderia xenovorans LB400]|uniref:Uncharacterized protein n=1 Tax=Paraburkholderia xenovorans (strain LB400) TaxID=266265 RepID=Q13V55_PARXL|nr:hypothetical protein Bxe_A0911 [Paraburkholderia xenovorans LB400]
MRCFFASISVANQQRKITTAPFQSPQNCRKPLFIGLKRHSHIVSERVILYCGNRNLHFAECLSTLCLTGNRRGLFSALLTRITPLAAPRVKVS